LENTSLEIQNLCYQYRTDSLDQWGLKSLNLTLRNGELIGLLGPSGCGKTTLLRLIAGFEKPTNGRIIINSKEVASRYHLVPPEKRGVGMVFQDYALFPHLNTWKNACFGLRRSQDKSRVEWLLDLLGLFHLRNRYPHELSGGQQQRLALVRALAPGTSILVLDEPFSNLDVDVRLKLRCELSSVLKTCSTTAILVTHDPEEALAICDRVAVMSDGEIHQCSTPSDLVNKPATSFVGRFVLQRNVVPIKIERDNIYTPLGILINPILDKSFVPTELMLDYQSLELKIDLDGEAFVEGVEFQGHNWLLRVSYREFKFRIYCPLEEPLRLGDKCSIRYKNNKKGLLFPGSIPCSLNIHGS